MSRKLTDYIQGRDNNFNLIRFIAASMVLFSHSFALSGHGRDEPLMPFGLTFGQVAVYIFFFTSGYLVSASLIKATHVKYFIVARVLRIYPGLIVANVFAVFVIGLMFTTLPARDYLTQPQVYSYLGRNSILFFSSIRDKLPGVFLSNIYPNAVNGSLWTLRPEVSLYAWLALIGLIGLRFPRVLNRARLFWVFGAAALYFCAVSFFEMEKKGASQSVALLKAMFFIGAVYCTMADKIVLRHRHLVGAVMVLLASLALRMGIIHVLLLTLGYIVLYLAYIPAGWIRRFNKFGDYSYGIYIYAFPIQQSISALVADLSPLKMAAMAYPIVLGCAILSWHLIEQPMLALRHRLPVPPPQPSCASPERAQT